MLDVETCQRLKKAGFPQGETPKFPPPKKSDDVCTNFDSVWKHENGEWVLLVRIEDLLRELPKHDPSGETQARLTLCWGGTNWLAGFTDPDCDNDFVDEYGGQTPEQALANLFLSLSKQ